MVKTVPRQYCFPYCLLLMKLAPPALVLVLPVITRLHGVTMVLADRKEYLEMRIFEQ
jgi:hypothetical protein